jgi:glycosyltransferase involved in cell wall biosynthesis
MDIALVSHNIVRGDGQGRVNVELARYLTEQGHAVHLIADRVEPALVNMGCTWHPVHPGFDGVDLLKVARFPRMADAELQRLGDQIEVTVACGVVLSRAHTVNAVHFVHGPWLQSDYHNSKHATGVQRLYQYMFSSLNARWERRTFAAAEHVVAVSPMVKDELLEIGIPAEKITVIINGVDLEEFAPGPADRPSLDLPEGPVLGLFVGDIKSPIKNLDTVLRALPQVPALHLAVAGDSTDSPYPALAEDLGVADRVHFLGFRRDVAPLMRAADFFLLPSRRDSCPLVLLEALASGLPVIASSQVGNAPLLDGGAGFVLADPEDVSTLTDHATALTTDPALRRRMSQVARSVAETHSWDRMAAAYLEVLRDHTPSRVPA